VSIVIAATGGIVAAQVPTRSATAGMWLMRPVNPQTGEHYGRMPGAFVRAARAKLEGFADLAIFGMASETPLRLTTSPDDRRQLKVSEMTPGALTVVGIPPVLGREFLARDAAGTVAILTYQAWQGLLAGDPSAIGTNLWRGPGQPVVIVGVLPRDFFIRVPVADATAEAFIPTTVLTNGGADDGTFAPLVRLRPAVSIDSVRAAVNAAVDSVRSQVGSEAAKLNARLDPADRPGWMK
jgi:hypothetical protein